MVEMQRGFLTAVNGGVAKIHRNQQEVETKAKELHAQTSQFAKQTAQWLQLVERFNASYEELGDVEQWTKGVESDLQTISTSLEYVASVTKRG